jgi:hypothetical protein
MLSAKQLAGLMDLLDDSSRRAVETIIKNLVSISDPDYVKLTKEEREKLDIALESDDFIDFDEFKESLGIVG